MIGHII